MQNILWTALFSLAAFGLTFLALGLGRLMGRQRERRCACAMSKAVMKQVADREKAAKLAARYCPETVNPSNLPILPDSLAESIRADK